ncbi:MAG: hypothetical protein HYX68_10655 [Planctomycetes bacterium]|nr:hypothetical protein [Planctomycetota bacterium]
MAQEDKGLVVRGLLLFAGISTLVAIVLFIVFLRDRPEPALAPEHDLPASPAGHDIRYNAAATLARRGSSQVPWPLIREMLDEKLQLRNNRVRLPDGRQVYDEMAARAHVIVALRALSVWHDKRADLKASPPAALLAIYPVVDRLAANSIGELKAQAEKASEKFFR